MRASQPTPYIPSFFKDLPIEVMMQICSYLDVETVGATLRAVNKDIFNESSLAWISYWKEKYKLHFPHVFERLVNKEKEFKEENTNAVLNWYAVFCETYESEYKGLSTEVKKLFSKVKEGSSAGLIDVIKAVLSEDNKATLLNLRDINKHTLLHWASELGHVNIVNILLGKKLWEVVEDIRIARNDAADAAEAKNKIEGENYIFKSYYRGRYTCDNLMQAEDVKGERVIHKAVMNGHFDIVKALASSGANVTVGDITPLDIAIANHHYDIATFLIKECSVNVNLIYHNKLRYFHYLVKEGNLEALRFLITNSNIEVSSSDLFDKITPLHRAATQGNLEIIRLILEKGADIHAIDEMGMTPLSNAVRAGHLEVVKLLLEKGNAKLDHNKSSMLLNAAAKGHLKIVEYLVQEKKFDVNVVDEDRENYFSLHQTPLHLAAKNGHLEIVKFFAEQQNINMNPLDRYGDSPLQLAAQKGHLAVVEYLIEEKQVPFNTFDKFKETPIQDAAKAGHLEIVEFLLSKNVHVDSNTSINVFNSDTVRLKKCYWLIRQRIAENEINKHASFYFKDEKTRSLFIAKAHELYTNNGMTEEERILNFWKENAFISSACQTAFMEKAGLLIDKMGEDFPEDKDWFVKIALKLSEHLKSCNFTSYKVDSNHGFFFEEFVLQRVSNILKDLRQDPNVDIAYIKENIYLAWEKNGFTHLNIVIAQAKIDEEFYREYSKLDNPLHAATRNGKVEIVNSILTSGVNIEVEDGKGNTALHIAAMSGQVEIVKMLLAHHPNVNARNNRGDTPFLLARGSRGIHLASQDKYEEIERLLLEHVFNKIKADVIKNAKICFQHENTQAYFTDKVKTLLQKDLDQPATTLCKMAYAATSQLLIEYAAKKLPLSQRQLFTNYAMERANAYLNSAKDTFEQEVISGAYQQTRRNKLDTLIMKRLPKHHQNQFAEIVRKNVLAQLNWEQDTAQWNLEIANAKELIAEKQKLIHFLRKESDRIRKDTFSFMQDKVKTHNKLYAIEQAIDKLKGKNGISNFKQLDTFKTSLSNTKDFTRNRSRLFSITESKSKKNFEEKWLEIKGIKNKK